MENTIVNDKQLSATGGIAIVAGTIIGAGMLTLPVISAGMWSLWTVVVIFISFYFMWTSANMILEVNLRFQGKGASFNTLVSSSLGGVWNIVNGLSVAFVLYILCYAYISGAGSALSYIFGDFVPRIFLVLFFSLFFVSIIIFSVRSVGRLSALFLVVMISSLVVSISYIIPEVSFVNLYPKNIFGFNYSIYILATLPYFLTSFCFHASVPSLVKYCNSNVDLVRRCITYGMIIALLFYLAWILCSFGLLNRSVLGHVYANGGNVEHLLSAIQSVVKEPLFNHVISIFAFFSIATSFLGAGLGLFDYIADLFKFDDHLYGRLKTAGITFLPPIVGSIFFPDGFILAIGFAGLAAAIWSVFIPALMVKKIRENKNYSATRFKVSGGNLNVSLVVFYGVVVSVCFILSLDSINLIPIYK